MPYVITKPQRVNPVNMMTYAMAPGPQFNIKMSSYQYRNTHCGDKTIVRSSYLHNGISYTGNTTSLYWIRGLATKGQFPHLCDSDRDLLVLFESGSTRRVARRRLDPLSGLEVPQTAAKLLTRVVVVNSELWILEKIGYQIMIKIRETGKLVQDKH